jgi:putative RecB family exonuclease
MDEAQLLAHYHKIWTEQIPRFLFDSVTEEQTLEAEGERILRAFFAEEQRRLTTDRAVFIEIDFKVPLRPGFVLTGRIDRIDQTSTGAYRVLDYKSSRRPLEHLMRPEDSFQLALYGLGAQNITGEAPESVGFYYLAHSVILSTAFTQAAADRVLAAFSDLADAVSSQVFTPDPAPEKCASCPYQPMCPVYHPEAAIVQF